MINRFREALTSSSAFSLVGWLLLLPWSYLVTSTLRPAQEPSTLFVLIAPLIAHTVGGFFVFAGYQIHKKTDWRLGPVFTLFVFLLYGFFRSASVNFLLVLDIKNHEVKGSLILTASIVALVWQVMTAIMIHYSRINLTRIRQLENRKKLLDSEIELFKSQLNFLRHELPTQINNKVQEVLVELSRDENKTKLGRKSAETLLSTLLNEYVRPLSRNLRESTSFPDQERKRITPITVRETVNVFVSEIAESNSFSPITVSAIVTASGLPPIMVYAGWQKLPTTLALVTFGIFAAVRVTEAIYRSIKKRMSLSTRLMTLGILWLLPGAVVGNLLLIDPEIANSFVYLRVLGPILTFVASTVSAVYFAGISQRTAVIRNLDRETIRKDFEKQALKQELKIAENQLIHLLHGKLQGQLNVLRTQIETGDNGTEATLFEIEQSLDQIRSNKISQQGFELTLNKLQRLWGRVTNIKVRIPDELLAKLESQQFVSFATIEIIREVLNNSVKHGQAKNIEISLSQTIPQQLEIYVKNDGAYVKITDKPGLGTQLLNDYCISWDIDGDNYHTEFRATVICPEVL